MTSFLHKYFYVQWMGRPWYFRRGLAPRHRLLYVGPIRIAWKR
jgi:hypothetical protein